MASVVVLDVADGSDAFRLDIPDTGGFVRVSVGGGQIYVLHDFDGIYALS
jgi:hypothetical protein